MATQVYDVSPYFATGATVGAYLRDSFPQSRIDSPDGAAPGFAATATAVVSSTGTVTFTTLADGTRYWLGTGSSPYDYVAVRTNPASSGGSGSAPTVLTGGNLGSSKSITVAANGESWQPGTLNANLTLTLALGAGGRLRLFGAQDATGGRTLTVTDGANSRTVEIPTLPLAAFEVDFYSTDGTLIQIAAPYGTGVPPATVATPAFSPLSVTGIEAWFDATQQSAFDADNVAVTTLVDWSGSGHHARSTGTARPLLRTNVVNGKPVLRFDGVNDRITATYPAWSGTITTGTAIMVVKRAAVASAANARIFTTNDLSDGVFENAGVWAFYKNSSNAVVPIGGTSTNWTVITVKKTSGTQAAVYLNGTKVGADFIPGVTPRPGFLNFGSSDASTDFFAGDLAEFVQYTPALSDSDRLLVERYLGTKYGITVA